MRIWWWACALIAVLTCSAFYLLLSQPLMPEPPLAASDGPARSSSTENPDQSVAGSPGQPVADNSDRQVADKDQARLADVDADPPALKQDQLPAAQQEARLEDAPRPEDASRSEVDEPSTRSDTKQNLSWLAFYAYSELPPDPKPADIVLDALSGVPPGTPVEEIRRVADILGLDSTFMKAVAKIESGFNPKQRTGSYIGLFQLSLVEFGKYGSGDIRNPRDNAIAGALKMMTEAALFETFTHRKPTLSDLYLIHQQGIDGATEHISQPSRPAWRAMCATDEGKEKGEKWCKRAIWGNTLPALKKAWKNVNNVTSAAFVGMWQERVSQLYSRYSAAAAN